MEEVRQASERYVKELRERIDQKLEVAQENREKQVKVIQERIKEHVSLTWSMGVFQYIWDTISSVILLLGIGVVCLKYSHKIQLEKSKSLNC